MNSTTATQPASDLGRFQRPVAHRPENIPAGRPANQPSPRDSIAGALKEQEDAICRLDHILTEVCARIEPVLRQCDPTECARAVDPRHGVSVLDAINERTAKINELAACMARINDRIAL